MNPDSNIFHGSPTDQRTVPGKTSAPLPPASAQAAASDFHVKALSC
jgi:hypothetical protein